MKNKLLKIIELIKGFFPTALPTGMQEFDAWSKSIISTYELIDNESTKFSIAVMVLHLDSANDKKPKRYFGKSVKKAMANQVVSQVIQDLKKAQEAANAVAAAKAAEVAAAPAVESAPNEHTTN